jgi:hypothetical protein
MILTARFKPSQKAKTMRTNLKMLAGIKDLALKRETLEREKKAKPNGSNLKINLWRTMMRKWMPLNTETTEEDMIEVSEAVH